MDKNSSDEQKMTDIGWRDMKTRLDRELPVAENSRRPMAVWFWFSMVFVGLLAVGGWLFFSKNGAEKSPVQPVEINRPVAASAEKSVEPDAQVVENRAVAANPIPCPSPEGKGESQGESSVPSPRGRGSGWGFPEAENKKLSTAQPPILKNPFSEKTTGNFSENKESTNEPIASLLPVDLEEKSAIRNPQSAILNLNPLSEKPVSTPLFETENRATNFSKTTIPFKSKPARRTNSGVFAGLQSIDFQRLNGFSVGFVAEKISRSGRQRLSVGFGWNRVFHANQPNLETDNSALFDQNFYVTETEDSLLLFADLIAPTTSIPVNGYLSVVVSANIYNRLAMPVSMSQKLGSRWHIGLGLTPSWLLSARSQIGGDLFHFQKNNAEALGSGGTADLMGKGYSLQSVNSLLDRSLPRFDLAATASLQADLTRKWRLGLEFQRGLVNQTALPDVKKFHRSTNMKLVRWF